jgi:hypothetical protein
MAFLSLVGSTPDSAAGVADAGTAPEVPTPAEQSRMALILLFVAAMESLVVAYPILRSRWGGWKLIATVFALYFGVKTFMPQAEALFFLQIGGGVQMAVSVMGLVVAALFAPLAVLVLGRGWALGDGDTAANTRWEMTAGQWIGRMLVAAVAYVVLYVTFGSLIAWQSPEVRSFYQESGSVEGFRFLFSGFAGVLTLQLFRGVLWALIALPVIRMMKGGRWESGLALGLLFAVLMNAQLLLPNPYMPEAVRMVHLVETASSNFLLGFLIAWIFRPQHNMSAGWAV